MLLDFTVLVVSLVEIPDAVTFALGVKCVEAEAEGEFEFLAGLVDDVWMLPSAMVVFVVRASEVAMDDFEL